MKLKKVLAGLMAAVTAVTASVCGLSVSAGAVSEKKEYSGSWFEFPPLWFKSSDDTRESGIYYDDAVGEKGTYAYVLEDVKPSDIVTFSYTTKSGEERIIDVKLISYKIYDIAMQYYSTLDRRYNTVRQLGICRSGISVNKIIDEYNYDLEYMIKTQVAPEDWVFKKTTLSDISGIRAVNENPDETDYYFEWKITIEPGKDSDSSNDISAAQFTKIKNQSYTGKAIKPAVTIKDGGKKLVKGTDYTVSYKNNTKIGTATVTVTGKGDYTGTKTLTFKIVPKKVTLTGKTSGTNETLSWKKSAGATGYEIYRSVSGGKFTKLTTTKSLKYTAKLTTGKNYQFKVRPYATVNGKKFYGSWSNVIKTK